MALSQPIDIRQIASSLGMLMTYRAGDVIFREGDEPRYVYVVLKGSVEMKKADRLIETVHAGRATGVLSLIDGLPRSSTAFAVEDVELAVLDERKFRYMVEAIPNVVWYMMGELAHRLRATNAAL